MARRSQCSDAGDNPLDPNYLPPHYREEYRLAIDALVEEDVDGYYKFLQFADVVDFLAPSEIDYIQHSVQLPKQQSGPEQRYLDPGGDGSSDTYWPLHSDLDAPGLDLGWPQIHHFIGPTEVTTLVNPAAPDMPSIKEQARRLIKNAQMVVAVVMDMFTDVDIFADILNAASRNVAVYLLLDEANVDHFINMVSNCRVNLQSIPYLRVRTVSGIRYHCRSGKSFKGQMLDRFILTDCRAVLSGNYSFMWSYEKLHRCMAHLFLGQLVSTFDEEFRILFAQSEPLVIENTKDMTLLQKRPLPGERPLLRDMRKIRTMDAGLQEDWNRAPYEENVDWRMMPLKRQETFHGPLDIYNRYPSPQSRLDPQTRLDPQFDQGPSRMMDSLAHKRHSFAEGGPGRYSLPYQQQGAPDVEPLGRPYYRGQQHLHPRDEPDYGGYGHADKFWNQDFQQEEPYPEPGYEPQEGYDPVLNYLSSTRNLEIDQSSDKLIPGPDLPYSTTHPRRHIGQAYACQTSPTPSNTTEKRLVPEHGSDRKDPTVKRGLRNWRISSYLSAYDNSGEPEGLPMGQDQTVDPFDDMPNPTQQPGPPQPAVELAVPKIPNVREFKVPALPRASQMPAFAKGNPRDFTKRFPDEIPQVTPPVLVIPEPKVVTPTPSESSSTTDGEKQEDPEQREPITSTLRRDDSFRRNYNAAAVQRSSRLRSSLIFSSLEQTSNQDNTEQDDDKTKAETDTTKLSFSQVLAQRRSGTREPFEWRNYIKPTDTAKTDDDGSKPAEKDSESKLESVKESQDVEKSEAAKTKEATKSPELAPEVNKALPKTEPQPPPLELNPPTKSFLSEPFVDMNDPDQRFLFFKELAAKRKAEKAAEEAKLKQESAAKDKVEEKTSDKSTEVSKKSDAKTLDLSGEKDKVGSVSKNVPQSSEKVETKVVAKDNESKSKEESKNTEVKTLDSSAKKDKVESTGKNVPTATQSCDKVETKIVAKEDKAEKTQKDIVSTTTEKSKHDSGLTPKPKIETKVATDSEKIEAKQSQAPQPTSTDKLTQEKQASQKTDATKPAEKQDESAGASAAGKVTDGAQPASTSKDPQLKPSRSVPDFTKTSMSDLLSSLPSSRISERSAQESNKETAPKARLWTPSLHRRDSLKAYGEKLKSLSTVVQEEAADEAGQTDDTSAASKSQEISGVKSQISDKTETKAEPATSASESKEGDKVKSGSTEVKKDDKEASPSPVSSVGPSKKTSTSPEKVVPESNKCQAKSTIGTPDVKVTSDEPKTNEKPGLATQEAAEKKEEKVSENTSQVQDKATTLASLSDTKQPQISQNKDSLAKSSSVEVKDSEKTNLLVEKTTKDQPKTELNQTQQEKGSDKQIDTSVKPDKIVEKSHVEAAAKTSLSGKDSAQGPIEKTSVTQEEAELTTDRSVVKDSSTLPSDKTEQEATVTSLIDESKQKLPEDFTQLESHSNTSSPASFATALEFMSSEDSDMFSPARTDPQNLFKLRNTESSVSDMSDFGTPNSDISTSPMPFAVNMDDGVEDNVSIAETVIEAVSRRISETTVEGRLQESPQIETPKERLSPETQDLDATAAQSEARTQAATSKEASGSNLATQGTKQASEDGKIQAKTEKEIANVVTKESPVCPASSQVQQETKLPEKASESSAKEEPTRDLQSEAVSINVKTQDMTGQSDSNAQLSDETTACPTSQATSGEMKDSKTDAESTQSGKETTEAESKPETLPTTQSTNTPKTVAQEPPAVGSKLETKPRTVSSRFLSQPSVPSVKNKESAVTPKVTEEVTVVEKSAEIMAESQSMDEVSSGSTAEMDKEAKEKKGQDQEACKSETKQVKTVEKTTDKETKEASAASESAVNEKGESKTEVPSHMSPEKQSETCPAKQDDIEKRSQDGQAEIGKEKLEVSSNTKQATSEDTKVLDKEAEIGKEPSAEDKSEQKSDGNLKDANETTSPKSQTKPSQSRYLSSTANVISSSNLRDDTKILLEQISAQSQSRNEQTAAAKEAPVTDDEKEDEADKNAKRKKENELRSSLGQQKSSQDREKVLERIQTMRKDRRVYSRFEL